MPYKIGLDTNFLLRVFENQIDREWLRQSFFPNGSVLFCSRKNESEFKGVIISKYGKDRDYVNDLWELMFEVFDINLIKWSREIDENIVKVRKANEILAKKRDVPGYQKTLKIGPGDIEIIANFMKEKIDRIYTSDDGFYMTCKELGLNAVKVITPDYMKMKKAEKESS